MSLAEIISIMPSVASRISTGIFELVELLLPWRSPTDMISVTAEPTSVSTFMKRANGSLTKAPPKASPSPPEQITTGAGDDQHERRPGRSPARLAPSPRIDADHQEHQRADGEDQLGRRRARGWRRGPAVIRQPLSVRRRRLRGVERNGDVVDAAPRPRRPSHRRPAPDRRRRRSPARPADRGSPSRAADRSSRPFRLSLVSAPKITRR